MNTFKGNMGIKSLALEIIGLISRGRNETISAIEREIENNRIVHYINNKYCNEFTMVFDDRCPYDIEHWNVELGLFSDYVEGNESRKFGIVKEEDGLLLLLALLLELMREK
ncbi:MAG: hypothetical protein ACRDCB_13260 [Clostridium sp.]|uniref:hypothetical protein n=1 Tax=Clostridium chrysemydis TaxID=2665504 RepID=UPI003EE75A7F